MRRLIAVTIIGFLLGFFSAIFSPKIITVSVDSKGFTPPDFSVKQGDVVIFKNVDTQPHWPASDPHPTHDAYYNFDPKHPIQPGEEWPFRAFHEGTWSYHDHLHPWIYGKFHVVKGSPVVLSWNVFFEKSNAYDLRDKRQTEKASDYVLSQMRVCSKFGGRHPCFQKLAELLFSQFRVRDLLLLFRDAELTDPAVHNNCHEVAHYLGRLVYAKTKRLHEAYVQCEVPACGVGCQHGASERYFTETGLTSNSSDEEILVKMMRACGKESDFSKQIIYHECLHGLGHGLMALTYMDVPRSLRLCDGLPSVWNREKCYSGVFMENTAAVTLSEHQSVYVSQDDPLYPCAILDAKYQKVCYEYHASSFGGKTGWDGQKIQQLCQRLPSAYQAVCLSQIAANQAATSADVRRMKESCETIQNDETERICVGIVVSTLGGQHVDDPTFMKAFCEEVDAQHKQTCYAQMGGMLRFWSYDTIKRREVCEQIADLEYINVCLLSEIISL